VISNDQLHPQPRADIESRRVLEYDFPGLEIGVAEYAEGPTGCTVIHFPKVASMQIDVRGGSPGINGEYLTVINAICFAGGSLYGLEASTGVAAELFLKQALLFLHHPLLGHVPGHLGGAHDLAAWIPDG